MKRWTARQWGMAGLIAYLALMIIYHEGEAKRLDAATLDVIVRMHDWDAKSHDLRERVAALERPYPVLVNAVQALAREVAMQRALEEAGFRMKGRDR